MKNPFRQKPAKPETLVLHDTPCLACDLADFVKIAPIQGAEVVECVNCKMQYFLDVLLKKGYTSGKG
jgi:hypothetical protein